MKALLKKAILLLCPTCLLSCIGTADIYESPAVETAIKACLSSSDTKLTIQKHSNVYKTVWDKTDSLCIFSDGDDAANTFVLESGAGQGTAIFKGKVSGKVLEAIYPYSIVDGKKEDGSIICTFPEIQQTFTDGNMGSSFPMYAYGSKDGLNFRNLAAVLGIPAIGIANIKSITFASKSGTSIAGKAIIDTHNPEVPSLAICEGGASSITLECAGEQLYDTPTYFYICIPAGEYKDGFILTFDTFNDTFVREYNGDYSFERSQIRFTETIEVEGEPVDDLSLISQPNLILYRSSSGKILELNENNPFDATIVSHKYVNGKGFIKLDNAPTTIKGEIFISDHSESVTEVYLPDSIIGFSSTFSNFSISEIRLPANTKTISGSFSGCRNLKEVILPEGVLHIGEDSFSDCDELQYVTIPSSLKTISPYVFRNCNKIQKFNGSNKLISHNGLFLYSNLSYGYESAPGEIAKVAKMDAERFKVPDIAFSAQYYSFSSCKEVKEIDLNNIRFFSPECLGYYGEENDLEAIYGKYCTDDHRSLISDGVIRFTITKNISEIVIPEGVTAIGSLIFSNPKSVKKIIVPEGVKRAEMYAFIGCPNLEEIHLPSTMEAFGYNPFEGYWNGTIVDTRIYLKAQRPPELDFEPSYINYSNLTIFVPKESLDLYRSSSDWEGLKDRIFGYDFN